MTAFLGFLGGQLLAIVLQVARWIDDTRGWGDYFRHRRHQGRHVADLVFSVFVYFAWTTGLLTAFADKLPDSLRGYVERLPATNVGPLVALVVGGGFAFAVRYVQQKWFDAPEPPASGDDAAPTKGD